MSNVRRLINLLPLGSAALAGTTYPLDLERLARTLGIVDEQGNPQVCQNSLDGVSDRDFAIEFTAATSVCMVHISRFSEELTMLMSQNLGLVRIACWRLTPVHRFQFDLCMLKKQAVPSKICINSSICSNRGRRAQLIGWWSARTSSMLIN
jgi:hypothetical protein